HLEVVAGEGKMPRFLGDVVAHDHLEQWVELAPGPQRLALQVIDRILATQHEDEEQLGESGSQLGDATSAESFGPRQARRVEAGSVDELLEHQTVLRFLD